MYSGSVFISHNCFGPGVVPSAMHLREADEEGAAQAAAAAGTLDATVLDVLCESEPFAALFLATLNEEREDGCLPRGFALPTLRDIVL
jgi:hypothetical protein